MKNQIEMLSQVKKNALNQGASECDIIMRSGKDLSISAFEQNIDKYQVSSSQIIGLRVIKDKKVGLASSESLDTESLETMVKQAINNSNFSSEAKHQSIKSNCERPLEQNSEENFKNDSTPIDQKIKLALELESKVKDFDNNAQTPYTAYGEGESEVYYTNSDGCSTYQKQNHFQCYTSALLKSDQGNATHFEFSLGKNFSQLNAELCAEKSYHIAKQLLTATPCSTGKYDVIFDTNNLGDLYGAFSGLFSAQTAMEGKNRFKDQLGQIVASDLLSIMDCPRYKDAFHQHHFDDEGYTMNDVNLLSNGRLESFLHSSETANYFNVAHNGRSNRGPKSSLNVTSTSTVIAPGSTSDIYNGTILKIIGLDGLHSGTNMTSGDFSLGARGFLIKDGEITQAVKGITVSGNFFELLKQIEAVGNRVKVSSDKAFFSPTIRFGKMDIAGS